MFSFFLHISEGKLVLICFDLLTELCSCHRHRLPLCPFNHRSISVDKVFPRKTEIPLFGDCVLSHGCALQQESVGFSGERRFPPPAQHFLHACHEAQTKRPGDISEQYSIKLSIQPLGEGKGEACV